MDYISGSKRKEDFYINELRDALKAYHDSEQDMERVLEEKRKRVKLVRSMMAVLNLSIGEPIVKDMLDKYGLTDMARPFMAVGVQSPGGGGERRRGRRRKEVDPSEVILKGSRVKMLSGTYNGCTGIISSAQIEEGKKGVDVTYFLSLEDSMGNRRRTSVKHGTLNKTWVVLG